jgi:hypothetical protein
MRDDANRKRVYLDIFPDPVLWSSGLLAVMYSIREVPDLNLVCEHFYSDIGSLRVLAAFPGVWLNNTWNYAATSRLYMIRGLLFSDHPAIAY